MLEMDLETGKKKERRDDIREKEQKHERYIHDSSSQCIPKENETNVKINYEFIFRIPYENNNF